VLAETAVSMTVHPMSVASVDLPSDVSVPGRSSSEVLVVDAGEQRAWWWFAADYELSLTSPLLTATCERDGDRHVATITTEVLVRDLIIYPDRLVPAATIDHQLISLLPGESTVATISGLGDADPALLLTKPYCWSAVL
jgi:beta-mannosidase